MTVVLAPTRVPALGDCETTVSAGWFESTVVFATSRPAASRVERALAYGWPTTFGIAICLTPWETLIRTLVLRKTLLPAGGFCAVTVSGDCDE